MKTNIQSKFKHQKLIFIAPMEGITNVAYRNVAVKYMNADIICTEFVRLSGAQFNPKQIRDQIKLYDNMTLSVQLMGDDPKLFAETIPYFEEIGVTIIDLNLGCPSTLVTKKGCGSAMLQDLDLLETVVTSIREACNVTFTCKMRSGWANDDQTVEIGQLIERSGADMLTIHPRTRIQGYDGHSKWQLISDLKQNLNIPVIGNGDIQTKYDASKMIETTNCDGIMIGRGALRDPFLLNKINDHLNDQDERNYSDLYTPFYLDYIEEMKKIGFQDISILNKMKEHFRYFTKFIENGEEIWTHSKRLTKLKDLTMVIENLRF